MSKTYNLYCDESCHLENDHKYFMFLGVIKAPYHKTRIYSNEINAIKKKHNFYAEIKWSTVSQSKYAFYDELIDYFFSSELTFRTIGINKSKIKNEEFGQTFDEFYYKMYYQLLKPMHDDSIYNVYIDIKDTLSANKIRKLKEILNSNRESFRNIQNIRSHESLLMQISDFLMGAVSYHNNDSYQKNIAKIKLIAKLKSYTKNELVQTNYNSKFNLFFINLQ